MGHTVQNRRSGSSECDLRSRPKVLTTRKPEDFLCASSCGSDECDMCSSLGFGKKKKENAKIGLN